MKMLWVIRGGVYKIFLGGFKLPSYIGRPAYIKNYRKIFIGRRVRIYPGARLEVLSADAQIRIGNNVSIGQNLHIVAYDKEPLVIGCNTTLSANVFITNTEHTYELLDVHIMDQPLVNKPTIVGENCFLGYGAVIQAGTILGRQCVVGANAVVKGEFPDYSVIVGAPARVVKRYDTSLQIWRKTNPDGSFL